MTTQTDTKPIPFGTDPTTGRLSLTLDEVRALVPIFPNPAKVNDYAVEIIRKIDPSLMSGPDPVLSLSLQGRSEDPAQDQPDLTVIFRNVGGFSGGYPDPVLSIQVFADPAPDRGHTGTFEMTYGSKAPDASKITLSGSTCDTPHGSRVVFNPPGSGSNPASFGAQVITGADLRIIAKAFEPKP